MNTIDGTQPHMKVWRIVGVFVHQMSSMESMNVAKFKQRRHECCFIVTPSQRCIEALCCRETRAESIEVLL